MTGPILFNIIVVKYVFEQQNKPNLYKIEFSYMSYYKKKK